METPRRLVIVLGTPVVGEKVDRKAAADMLFDSEGLPARPADLARLNGEFTVISFRKADGNLHVVNDRFAAYPFYYWCDAVSGLLVGSQHFSDLWHWLAAAGRLTPNHESLFEFLWLQRVLGVKTHASGAFFLPDASVFSHDGRGEPHVSRYWSRSYVKSNRSLRENQALMAELTMQAVRRKTSDGLRYGHFLSGGMDSRTVLAAFSGQPPTCFTATVSENNREARTARAIAAAKGAKHVHLELDPEHYGRILNSSAWVCGGMYNYDHGLFYGFNDSVTAHADAVLHGHGFDYMFQGMYIPRRQYQLAGRVLYYKTLAAPPSDLAGAFIDSASYRIKGADIPSFLTSAARRPMMEALRASVDSVLSQARQITDNPYDLWELLTFHHISRHYSYPNHASIATFVEQRTPSFDNDLFDFYLALPVEHRFDARVERGCLQILDPRLASIPSANTSYPVTASCARQTFHQLKDFVVRRLKGFQDYEEWTERTWPERPQAIRRSPILKGRVMDLADGQLDMLPFLDSSTLAGSLVDWLEGRQAHGVSGDLAQTLLSLSTFLRLAPSDNFKVYYGKT